MCKTRVSVCIYVTLRADEAYVSGFEEKNGPDIVYVRVCMSGGA